MRFHCTSLPHLAVHRDNSACAFSTKVLRFAAMMTDAGHECVVYGGEGDDVRCTEHVDIFSAYDRELFFGTPDRDEFPPLTWDVSHRHWVVHNRRTVAAMRERVRPGDFVCLVGGNCQKPIADGLAGTGAIICEPFIGYEGSFADNRVFESYAQLHVTAGRCGVHNAIPSTWGVCPNYYEISDYPAGPGGDNFVFIGRVSRCKGVETAVAASRAAGVRLTIAGQGARRVGHLLKCDGFDIDLSENPHVTYVGRVGPEARAELVGGARAIFAPSVYAEPFCGVVAEAALMGTPALTTDFGAFPETIEDGRTGFRCRTMGEFVEAVAPVGTLDREYIRARAVRLWSIEAVRPMFERFFRQLAG